MEMGTGQFKGTREATVYYPGNAVNPTSSVGSCQGLGYKPMGLKEGESGRHFDRSHVEKTDM